MPTIDSAGNAVCTQTRKAFLEEGRRSFPSGHASTSFAGLGFAALFLAGQLHIFDGAAWAWKLTLSFCPIVLAAFVAITRVLDFRHHCIDVIVGAALGIVVTTIVYHAYFPSPYHGIPDEPYTTRLDRIREDGETPSADVACPC
jgi:diacylglycerol diphosphate phosphatase/phosphatidate phosphatase